MSFISQPILLDSLGDLALAESGYHIFPILGNDLVQQLTSYYFEIQKETPQQFYSSTHSGDFSFRKSTSDFIKSIIWPLMPDYFRNYQLLGGAYVVKPPNGKGILQPHQDWNIVDEEKGRSYNLWIPLTDVTVENGAVFVLKGSHRKMNTYRGPGIPSLLKDVEALVWQNMSPLPMKTGEALLYDHALVHGSPVNQSAYIRLGIVCGIIPIGEQMQLYFGNEGKINSYRTDEHFFLEKDPTKGPDGLTLIKQIQSDFKVINQAEFKSIFLDGNHGSKKNWFSKFLSGNKA